VLIVGELINTSRKAIKEAVDKQDAEYIKNIAKEQFEAGANYIDVNCGTMVNNEVEIMEWLVNNIQEAVEAPLCIDSPNPKALEAGLALCKYGQPMINSISDEKARFHNVLPLVLKHKAKVVALCMDDTGMPDTADDRMRVVKSLHAKLIAAKVPEENIYYDPLVKPISSVETAALPSYRQLHSTYPQHHLDRKHQKSSRLSALLCFAAWHEIHEHPPVQVYGRKSYKETSQNQCLAVRL
jgi:5-methyltetrahydrofolate--homocysteine methyltransferase